MGMPKDNTGHLVPIFAPDRAIAVTAGELDTTTFAVIIFEKEQTISINDAAGISFVWPKEIPFGISPSVKKLHISVDCNALVMI